MTNNNDIFCENCGNPDCPADKYICDICEKREQILRVLGPSALGPHPRYGKCDYDAIRDNRLMY